MTAVPAFVFENAVLGYLRAITPEPLNLTIPARGITALVGRNGSGKTTLVKAMLGERVVLSGKVSFGGETRNLRYCHATEISRRIAFVPQENFYPGDLAVNHYLQLAFLPKAGFFGKLPAPDAPEIVRVLREVGLSESAHRRLRELSTGERQRVYLARAFLQQTEILLLDEPTNHLDPAGVNAFWHTLALATSNQSVVVSTHDLNFVFKQADHVIALEKGKVVFEGEKANFFQERVAERLFNLTFG